jgi:hypothetical protein
MEGDRARRIEPMGRNRRYATDADRQRAYRVRIKERGGVAGGGVRVRELEAENVELAMLLEEQRDRAERLEEENRRLAAMAVEVV